MPHSKHTENKMSLCDSYTTDDVETHSLTYNFESCMRNIFHLTRPKVKITDELQLVFSKITVKQCPWHKDHPLNQVVLIHHYWSDGVYYGYRTFNLCTKCAD
jgi:hypothetical protein